VSRRGAVITRQELDQHLARIGGSVRLNADGPMNLAISKSSKTVAKGRNPGRSQWARMNKGERRYHDHLTALRAAGRVLWFAYEPWSIRLADSTHYQCDFGVLLADGTLEIHDVKGRKGERYYVEEDSWVKIKTVASLQPMVVRIVWQMPDGYWKSEEIPG
jgi:hypothetical protein